MFLIVTAAAQHTAERMIVTIVDDWNTNAGVVMLFERSNGSWKKMPVQFSVMIGQKGLGWGTGIHPAQEGTFTKKEGDKRSPAGLFELDTVLYGLAPEAPEGVRMPYRMLTSLTRCIDDTASVHYNTIIEEGSVPKDWNSAEQMQRVDPDYKYVLNVRNNAGQQKGAGSCIFFHINPMPTSGCTAMEEEDMVTLLRWLDPALRTVIVQLPQAEYHRLQKEWDLPAIINN
ncbi:MAG: L,D-transpeptidase family protein [Bacteroidetes bacterium]|nr:L,D-transpeptidase family protein [Bacteroidota bacterium]